MKYWFKLRLRQSIHLIYYFSTKYFFNNRIFQQKIVKQKIVEQMSDENALTLKSLGARSFHDGWEDMHPNPKIPSEVPGRALFMRAGRTYTLTLKSRTLKSLGADCFAEISFAEECFWRNMRSSKMFLLKNSFFEKRFC